MQHHAAAITGRGEVTRGQYVEELVDESYPELLLEGPGPRKRHLQRQVHDDQVTRLVIAALVKMFST
eukprot:609680-Hanusia_phi.AAC.2